MSWAICTGDVIQWKRGNMLGKGAYGIVWCGLTNVGELIAVKQIELNVTDMERAEAEYEKIQEEVDLLKTLRHKNIVGSVRCGCCFYRCFTLFHKHSLLQRTLSFIHIGYMYVFTYNIMAVLRLRTCTCSYFKDQL